MCQSQPRTPTIARTQRNYGSLQTDYGNKAETVRRSLEEVREETQTIKSKHPGTRVCGKLQAVSAECVTVCVSKLGERVCHVIARSTED